jgi:hypothetical protein
MTFTVVYYETNRIERSIEAATVEEAIAVSEASRADDGDWKDYGEESRCTDGVVEVLDAAGKRVFDSGPASLQELFDHVIDRRARLAQIYSRRTGPAAKYPG